ncbi:hypothetical protein LGQ02_09475 [Bacillus shivajii]|uniref:hypothetical protein n=1 Tax=Bacillus shivajii TaxID=1983719 RepID=UPI001CFA7866|nr:hypothetical protein [Bacillus shivajii]UCZ54951.1 hypothetical protein LGQ02_09475 [Bacillus shivajii]
MMEIMTSYERKGMEKGMEKGYRKGKKLAKVEVAKKLLSKEMPVEEVVEVTGLSKEQVEQLKKEI